MIGAGKNAIRRTAAAAAFLVMAGRRGAQAPRDAFPSKPIRWLVVFAPGGGSSRLSRLVAQKLNDRWQVPVVVDNRAGAAGGVAMQIAAAVRAGRQHRARDDVEHGDQLGTSLQEPLRGARPFRRGHAEDGAALRPARKPAGAGALRRGDRRAREKPGRTAQLRILGHRIRRAPGDGTVQEHGGGSS